MDWRRFRDESLFELLDKSELESEHIILFFVVGISGFTTCIGSIISPGPSTTLLCLSTLEDFTTSLLVLNSSCSSSVTCISISDSGGVISGSAGFIGFFLMGLQGMLGVDRFLLGAMRDNGVCSFCFPKGISAFLGGGGDLVVGVLRDSISLGRSTKTVPSTQYHGVMALRR